LSTIIKLEKTIIDCRQGGVAEERITETGQPQTNTSSSEEVIQVVTENPQAENSKQINETTPLLINQIEIPSKNK